MCFTFYYYMYGNDTGSLNVYLHYNGKTHTELSIIGEKGQKWLQGQVEITAVDVPYKVSVVPS